jgi:hypothetical protein
VRAAGFVDVEIVRKFDIFEGAPKRSSALEFGTQGITLRARRP